MENQFQRFNKIEVINKSEFDRAMEDYYAGRTSMPSITNKDFFLHPFGTQPASQLTLPENFPSCCATHKKLYENALEMFEGFPNCCDNHRALNSQIWFNKLDYIEVPINIVTGVTYTMECIYANLDEVDWYKRITDYIKYTVDSYGQLPAGFGPPVGLSQYVDCVRDNIADSINIPEHVKVSLLKYFADQSVINIKSEKKDSMESLISIYRMWLKIFPFDIGYLSHLKPYFYNMLPVLSGKIETNLYTGISSAALASEKDLRNFIKRVTNDIFTQLNSAEAFKKGTLLIQNEKTAIEVLNAEHMINIELLTKDSSGTEKSYLVTLKKWLALERKYLGRLSKMLKNDYSEQSFLLNMIDGMRQLQSGNTNEDCITTVRQGGADKEAKARNWFRNFLASRYKDAVVTAEELYGNRKIDIKLHHPKMGTKILEFKGWWNSGKNKTIRQILDYLTDFQVEGYIFMINHLENEDITDKYKKLVTIESNGYIENSWLAIPVENAHISYFVSEHKLKIYTKKLYHFIFNVNF